MTEVYAVASTVVREYLHYVKATSADEARITAWSLMFADGLVNHGDETGHTVAKVDRALPGTTIYGARGEVLTDVDQGSKR